MFKRNLLLLLLFLFSEYVAAAVPIINKKEEEIEKNSTKTYLNKIRDFLNDVEKTRSSTEQLLNITTFIEIQKELSNVCINLGACDKSQREKLDNYLNSLNDGITSQFQATAKAIETAKSTIDSLQKIIDFVGNYPQNTKTIVIDLQKSTLATQVHLKELFNQMLSLSLKNSQKNQVEEKIELNTTNSIYKGFNQNGL